MLCREGWYNGCQKGWRRCIASRPTSPWESQSEGGNATTQSGIPGTCNACLVIQMPSFVLDPHLLVHMKDDGSDIRKCCKPERRVNQKPRLKPLSSQHTVQLLRNSQFLLKMPPAMVARRSLPQSAWQQQARTSKYKDQAFVAWASKVVKRSTLVLLSSVLSPWV